MYLSLKTSGEVRGIEPFQDFVHSLVKKFKTKHKETKKKREIDIKMIKNMMKLDMVIAIQK